MQYLFLLLHLTGLVGYTLLLRKSRLAKLDKYLVSALMTTAMFVPIIIALLMNKVDFSLTSGQYFLVLVQSLLYVGVNLLTVQALNHLEASVFTIIYSTRLLWVTVLAYIFLKELPPLLQIIGGISILGSILLLNLHKNKQYLSLPVIYGFLATIWFSFNAVAEKNLLNQIGVYNAIFWGTGLAMIFQWLLVVMRKTDMKPLTHLIFHKDTAWLMLFRPMSMWFYILSLSVLPVALVNYVSGMGVAIIVLLGIVILGERTHVLKKVAASGVALVGLTLILISKILY